jgi:purine-cytosine permease-like protein
MFVLGFVEMFITAYWTKVVSESRVLMSGLVTVVNILIWFYVLRTFVDDINNFYLVIIYTLGCASGVMFSGYLSNKEKAKKKLKREKTERANKLKTRILAAE